VSVLPAHRPASLGEKHLEKKHLEKALDKIFPEPKCA